MKLYLRYNSASMQHAVHGVHYHKGLTSGRFCGKTHEFQTKNCVPVVWTEEDIKGLDKNDFVELKSWHNNKKIRGNAKPKKVAA